MLESIVIALVLCGQAPPSAEDVKSWKVEPSISQSQRRKQEMERTIEKSHERRAAKSKAKLEKERREAEEVRKSEDAAERAYRATLPLILENRRQQIDIMNSMQISAALNQVAQSNRMMANSMFMRTYWPYPYFFTGGTVQINPGLPLQQIPGLLHPNPGTHSTLTHPHHGR